MDNAAQIAVIKAVTSDDPPHKRLGRLQAANALIDREISVITEAAFREVERVRQTFEPAAAGNNDCPTFFGCMGCEHCRGGQAVED